MNDEMLDQELQSLFAANVLPIDPASEASVALLESITAVAPASSGSSGVVDEPVLEGDVIEHDIIELHQSSESSDSTRWLMAAAAAVLVAVLGFGLWSATRDDASSPVISEDVDAPDEDSGEPVVDELVLGDAPSALVTIVSPGALENPAVLAACQKPPAEDQRPFPTGQHAVEFVRSFDGSPFSTVVTDNGTVATVCDGSGEPIRYWSYSAIIDVNDENPVAPILVVERVERELAVTVMGRVADGVVLIEIIDPVGEDHEFVRNADWFQLNATVPPEGGSEIQAIRVTSSDGSIVEVTHDNFASPTRSLDDIVRDAEMVDAADQVDALADGVVTDEEYRTALSEFELCMNRLSVVQFNLPEVVEEGTQKASSALACYDATVVFLDQAKALAAFQANPDE